MLKTSAPMFMIIFTTILLKLIPLYLMIILGYIGTKVLRVQKESIAKLLFYSTYSAEINFANLSLPILFFCLASVIAITFHMVGNIVLKNDSTKNILAFTAGTGNTGYFGLPVISAVLGDQAFSLTVLSILGFVLYENSVGFFLTAKANHSVEESLWKVIKLPTIYAFFIGLIFNLSNIHLGGIAIAMIGHFKGAYTFLGIIVFDKYYLHFYNQSIYNVMMVMAIVPLAANTVAVATELNVHPNKAALAVLLSTLFALFYIPLIVSLFIIH